MRVKVLCTAGFLALALGVSLVGTTENASAPLTALLQAGICRGYPGIAMITAGADGSTEAAAVGYSNLERHTALRIDDGRCVDTRRFYGPPHTPSLRLIARFI